MSTVRAVMGPHMAGTAMTQGPRRAGAEAAECDGQNGYSVRRTDQRIGPDRSRCALGGKVVPRLHKDVRHPCVNLHWDYPLIGR
jgi:hypothetical protein